MKITDIIRAALVALLVFAAAVIFGLAAPATAGPMDQGPHTLLILDIQDPRQLYNIETFDTRHECIVARDFIYTEVHPEDRARLVIFCAPTRNL